MRRWIQEGNTVAFLTLTMPHDFGEQCADLMDTIAGAFSLVFSGRPYRADRERFQIEHYIRTWDATHGANGWHPHIHAALFLRGGSSDQELRDLEQSLFERWKRAVTGRGHRPPSREHGIHLEASREAGGLAHYLLKIRGESSGASLAMELTRGDLKRGSGRTPFEILASFASTGDVRDLGLFLEWERATKGRHFSRWSVGAREALGINAMSDREIVEKEVGGVPIYRPSAEEWHAIVRYPGGLAVTLDLAETEGAQGVVAFARLLIAGARRRTSAAGTTARTAAPPG